MSDLAEKAIKAVLQNYFDALYTGDADLFAQVLHPEARLYCATGGEFMTMTVPAYLDVVRGRASPASRNDPRDDKIISINIASPTTAHVRVSELFIPKHFVDDLTLIFVENRWQIVAKVWHFVIVK
jgi:Putative lumazine-binding